MNAQQQATKVAQTMPAPIVELRQQLQGMEGQFKAALPAHIPVERFMRVVLTALQNNPDLIECERRSLWNAAMRAAQDGLLPDSREGAIVVFRDASRGKVAQWFPMIAGIRKKVRNSGEIATWDAHVVHANDLFEFCLGDEPQIIHRPNFNDPGPVVAAYSIAILKSGERSREVMSVNQIERVRARSRARNNGPWVTDYEEMCRKTVARRHSKVLPMSTDLDDLIRRDDDLYDFEGAKDDAQATQPKSLAQRLDVLSTMRGRVPAIDNASTQDSADDETQTASPEEEQEAEVQAGTVKQDTQQAKPAQQEGGQAKLVRSAVIQDAEANDGVPAALDRRGTALLEMLENSAAQCAAVDDLIEVQQGAKSTLAKASPATQAAALKLFKRHFSRLSNDAVEA